MATIVFGTIGVLASRRLGQLAGFSVLVSSGTLLASIGLSQSGVTAGALFYLVSSTLTIGAFFLLIELVERGQDAAANDARCHFGNLLARVTRPMKRTRRSA